MNSASRRAPTHSSVEAQRRLAYFDERRDEIVSTIRDLVEIESPSDNKPAVDRLASDALSLGQRDPALTLVLAAAILVRSFADLIRFEEQHLSHALVGINFRR